MHSLVDLPGRMAQRGHQATLWQILLVEVGNR
jgi:hypothetical protein